METENYYLINFIKTAVFLICCMMSFSIQPIFATQLEEPPDDPDPIVFEYINKNMPDSEIISSRVVVNAANLLNPQKNERQNINNQINFSVYTFRKKGITEPVYDTIIDYSFINPMKVRDNDQLIVQVSNFLRPITPINGMLLTKTHKDEDWKFSKEVTPVMDSLQSFALEGEQLANQDNYARVIIHFSSLSNPDSVESELPEYLLQYTHDSTIYLSLSKTQLGFFFIVVSFCVSFFIKRKKLTE